MTLSVSPDEKQIAYADSAGTIFITFIKTWEIVNTIKTGDVLRNLKFFQN